jgi:dTDP-glucose 4,6-dehydratase
MKNIKLPVVQALLDLMVRLFVKNIHNTKIFNLDALTYAGNLENIVDIEKEPNYTFVKGDIVGRSVYRCVVWNINLMGFAFGCRSHVDRSITDPLSFVKTM